MRIAITGVMVTDRKKTLAFYTEVLGSIEKRGLPAGSARWLTVVSLCLGGRCRDSSSA